MSRSHRAIGRVRILGAAAIDIKVVLQIEQTHGRGDRLVDMFDIGQRSVGNRESQQVALLLG